MSKFSEFWKKETDREPDFSQDRDFDARVIWNAALDEAVNMCGTNNDIALGIIAMKEPRA